MENNSVSGLMNDAVVLAITMLYMRLHLYVINGMYLSGKHRAVTILSTMIWLTSLSGACMITKRNIVAESISFVFIVMRDDVQKTRNATSEPAEHSFGNARENIREFTTLEFAQLGEKLARRNKTMYASNLHVSRDPKKDMALHIKILLNTTRLPVIISKITRLLFVKERP